MKRGAEKYLSKDDVSEDEEEIEPASQGFQKADDAILATRKIRALPKRSRLSTPPSAPTISPTTPDSTATPKFAGFVGFGAPPSSQPEPQLSFGTTAAMPTPSAAPALAPTASNTAKTFAAFLGTPPSPSLPKPTQKVSAAKRSPELKSDSDDSAALKYYTALRGLNVSFLSTLSKVTEDDPFADASTVFERYTSYRRGIQEEFDESKRETVSTPAPPMKVAMPAPPLAFSFGSTPTASTQNASNGSTAKPSSASAPSSGFSFSFPPQPSSTSLPAPAFGTTLTESSSSATSKPQAPSTPFSFSSPSPSAPSPFKFGGTSATSGAFTFGGSSSTSTSASADNKPSTTSTPFAFGVQSTMSKDKPSSVPFGTSQLSTAPFGTFGGFGKSPAVGSIGNPVGFGFGSSSKPGEKDSSVTHEELAPASTSETEKSEDVKEGDAQTEVVANSFLTTSPHDVEGEGEEDEETLHAVKLKAYRLKKADEPGGTGWVELGYGVLRMKKHKETDSRRLLLRNSANGKININFNLYPGMAPSRNKRAVTFVGHDSGVAQTYSLRLQTEEQATKLKDVLDREIALVKAKPDT